jgi:hypothetical protein
VEAYEVVRCYASHIVYIIGTRMVLRLPALRTGRVLLPRKFFFLPCLWYSFLLEPGSEVHPAEAVPPRV